MKKRKFDLFEWAICNKSGHVLEQVVKQGYSLPSFLSLYFSLSYPEGWYEDLTMFSQSPRYIVAVVLEQGEVEREEGGDEKAAFWLGFLCTSWYYAEGKTMREIIEEHGLQRLLFLYDTMHTQSIEYVIDWLNNKEYIK